MVSIMGRPRIHDAATGDRLLLAAEAIIAADGLEALALRALAERVDTSTRAVYSVFGSKDGLFAALAARAYQVLGDTVSAAPLTHDHRADLVAAGLRFRAFANERPALYQVAFGLDQPPVRKWPSTRPSHKHAIAELRTRIARLVGTRVGEKTLAAHTLTFHAACEGLAALERRGVFPHRRGDEVWTDALATCVRGIGTA